MRLINHWVVIFDIKFAFIYSLRLEKAICYCIALTSTLTKSSVYNWHNEGNESC